MMLMTFWMNSPTKPCARCEKERSKIDKVKDFFSSKTLADKINEINRRLDDISADKDRYMLVETTIPRNSHDHRVTSSFAGDIKIVGRENDKSHIVKMLFMSSSENISVISIVGMGGLGKTTLAQMVYKDDQITENFDAKIWVCVSKEFDVRKILTNIIESITEKKYDMSNFDVIVRDFRKCLSGKKCLLVLDDLWNEDSEVWENLRNSLSYCANYGSRILITTRKEEVASLVKGEIPPYILKTLSKEECWSIIKNKAFSPGGPLNTSRMIEIGEEIAARCGGLPLAANFLGSLMHSKGDEDSWLSIQNHTSLKATEIHNKIISILKLSYDNLSSRLKQCFSYCSLFPRDWEINRETLIWLWMAEGFLHHSGGEYQMSPEDIGDSYFHSLLSWSFFEDVKTNKLGDIQTCKMHDFVHDLAKSVSGNHGIAVSGASEMKDVSQVRRLQLLVPDKEIADALSKVLKKATKLRTVFSVENKNLRVENLLSNKCLRVVCLLGEHSLRIPSSVFKFKHLRYLDLSYSQIEEAHRASIHKLYNLQTLVLHQCIGVSKILESIGSLKILMHLDLSCSDIRMLPDSILGLINLQTLDLNGCSQFEALHANMGSLQNLKFLNISSTRTAGLPDSITCIENLSMLECNNCTMLEALPTGLGALTRLRCLDLKGTEVTALPESCIYLRNLEMIDFGDKCELPREIRKWPKLRHFRHARVNDEMPRGVEDLTCLQILSKYMVRQQELSGRTGDQCIGNGSGIEELGGLKSLRLLTMTNVENVRGRIDAERAKLNEKECIEKLYLFWYVSRRESVDIKGDNDEMVLEGLRPHSNLKQLSVDAFAGLKFPRWMGLSDCLPNLTAMFLENCSSCEQLPSLGLLPCLRVLHIIRMKSVKRLGEEFYYQQKSKEIEGESSCSSEKGKAISTKASLFPSLVSMRILDMENLEEWIVPSNLAYTSFPSFEVLIISNCRRMIATPVNSFSSLTVLALSGASTKMVHQMLVNSEAGTGLSSLTKITINNSPELILFSLHVLPNHSRLQSLQFWNCFNFQGFLLPGPEFDYTSSSLRSLDITGCPCVMPTGFTIMDFSAGVDNQTLRKFEEAY
ncbi:disease resistance protein RGA2-like [Papaver somniferum]|uniref:disease resistance protein RGA2-like n=1 Tax=Papaver somniferum TaxID=3469 RepID=UPI000E7060E0|nr:disease resistance protein RGA2-like [Papaver somniferum]XP_026386825.1 disease resistance protein RGA2-like [Papaver somniferum]